MCPSFPFGIEFGMSDVIVLISDHCLSVYFAIISQSVFIQGHKVVTASFYHIFQLSNTYRGNSDNEIKSWAQLFKASLA